MNVQGSMQHQEAVSTHAAERYLLDEMPEPERDAFEAHFFECAICAESVRTGAALADAARAGHVAPGVTAFPAPATRPARRHSWVPFAAAAALALVTGYQTFVTIPSLRQVATAPRALAPVALAPASRGEGAIVTPDPAGGPVVFALDVNATVASPQLVYDLRTDSDDVLLTGQAPVPPQGTPLLLLIPGTSLTSGQYAIVVREVDSPAREVGTYRFTVR
jgi:hypothetical protein